MILIIVKIITIKNLFSFLRSALYQQILNVFYNKTVNHKLHELFANILNIKKLEKVTAFCNVKKVAAYNKKWDITNRKLPL